MVQLLSAKILLLALCVSAIFIVFHDRSRLQIRNWVLGEERTVLSTVSGNLTKNGPRLKVVKIQTGEELFLEVYAQDEQGIRRLMDRIKLLDRRDGYFHFHGRATNLALEDVDGDSTTEIIAPSYDEKLNAHLNVYRFDDKTKKFHMVTGQQSY